ncbi:PREDICTED: uncharacterized protein LOC105360769 [Ceratosolen solmsi marchali]|uniref:serine--tRNA ligase n=1 Tax=Ceratosolen solmsi marchali TaxID=326594 RepID=A0AAJ6YDJ3_9HYME|nr:PREDICTED: uncharacterized protein LOC105360769 [Ceratosolen solmsi marchali]
MNFLVSYTSRCNLRLNINLHFIKSFLNNEKRYSSSLYIPGNKANKVLSFLRPDLNFDNYFEDLQKTEKELNLRGYKADLEYLKANWHSYKVLTLKKIKLEKELKKYSNQISIVKNNNATSGDTSNLNDLINKCKCVKTDLKLIKENIWNIEEVVIPELLKLPNNIDKRTPIEFPVILKTVGQKPDIIEDAIDHVSIGTELGLLEYKSAIQYFLCNEAVVFECGILSIAGRILNDSGIMRVAGPDFCRSIVIEGAGIDHQSPLNSFIIKDSDNLEINRLHVVGSASAPALLAIYTKKIIQEKDFPVKIFNTGRQYVPIIRELATYGLFAVCQASAVQTQTNDENYQDELENLINVTSKIYDEIGSHYQVVIKTTKDLDLSERMRVSFEMWSSYLNCYIEVGHISVCGDYFSKRLLIGCKSSNNVKFPAAITGTLLSVPKILGCLFEENPKKFVVPENVKGFF